MTPGCLEDLTELSVKLSSTALCKIVKSVGGVTVLVPTYLIQLNACGTLPESANRSFKISLAVLLTPVK